MIRTYCLHISCLWEEKTVRKLIHRGKLAASLCGKDERETGHEQDCPICLLHYDELNRTKCCNATICTECYLQVQDPVTQSTPCPLCKCERMNVSPAKTLNLAEAAKREKDEQKVIEATIQARKNSESIPIKLPQDPSIAISSERSQVQVGSKSIEDIILSSSTINESINTPRSYYDLTELLDNRYHSYSRYNNELYNVDGNYQSQWENVTGHDDIVQLSEENQLALAIQMSLRES